MNAALLNRNVLAELLFCKLEEGPALVTRRLIKRKALDTVRFHVAMKSIESCAILLLDQHTKLVPQMGPTHGLIRLNAAYKDSVTAL
jgi:hypothetical protein